MASDVTVAIVGAGNRGELFANLVAAEGSRVVAVAEPRTDYRRALAGHHGIPEQAVFSDWREMAARPRLADAVVVATPDREHVGPAQAFTRQGYHMLLEKPMAVSLTDCHAIAAAQRDAATVTSVCHSLRYNRVFDALKRVLDSGRIGRVVTVDHLEQVTWWHQAHSFVRGNWGNQDRSTFMLLAKSCHDIDYLAYLVGTPCRRVSSFGSLSYFRPEHAPTGSGERCVACAIERRCAYSAIKTYVEADRGVWPAYVVSRDHSAEAHRAAITNGPYGRCVWKTDNDVVDHQVVALEFDGGVTATFTMTAFTQTAGRKTRVHGTEGEVEFTEERMWVRTFADGRTETVTADAETGGHGGGDERVVRAFLEAVRTRDTTGILSDVTESLRTHSIVFAAETARREGRVVSMDEAAFAPAR
jgi:predicted dehydrogenase